MTLTETYQLKVSHIHLNKDVVVTLVCVVAGMQQASINLTQSLHEVYEPDWHGKDDIVIIGKV